MRDMRELMFVEAPGVEDLSLRAAETGSLRAAETGASRRGLNKYQCYGAIVNSCSFSSIYRTYS